MWLKNISYVIFLLGFFLFMNEQSKAKANSINSVNISENELGRARDAINRTMFQDLERYLESISINKINVTFGEITDLRITSANLTDLRISTYNSSPIIVEAELEEVLVTGKWKLKTAIMGIPITANGAIEICITRLHIRLVIVVQRINGRLEVSIRIISIRFVGIKIYITGNGLVTIIKAIADKIAFLRRAFYRFLEQVEEAIKRALEKKIREQLMRLFPVIFRLLSGIFG